MWSSKTLGVLLAVALGRGFVTSRPGGLVLAALWVGIGNELEGFAVSAILPAWQTDVPSIVHALAMIRRARLGLTSSVAGPSPASRARL
jgi:hypothetical protein